MRSENGNGRERGNSLKFVHWNPGSAFLQNKMDEIEALVELEQPNILGISEANFNLNTPEYEVLIPNYKLVLPNMSPSVNSVARTVLYVREDLQYKVRLDLMPVDSAVIWVEISGIKGRKLLVGNVYREFTHLGQGPASASHMDQKVRWGQITDCWRTAGKERETVVLGDMNLDFNK